MHEAALDADFRSWGGYATGIPTPVSFAYEVSGWTMRCRGGLPGRASPLSCGIVILAVAFLGEEVALGYPCRGFGMENAVEAFGHFIGNLETVADYGAWCGAKQLYTWDDEGRILLRCKKCGGYVLEQRSDVIDRVADSFYVCFFPVSGPEEAAELNRRYDGYDIMRKFGRKFILKANLDEPSWRESQ